MAIIKILQYPDPRLKKKGRKVETVTSEIQRVIDDMFETHYSTPNCAALAATQLDFADPWHITVIDFSVAKNQPLCLINGEIILREGETVEEEGCMSVPGGTYEKVQRSAKIRVRALDRHGKPLEFDADGFMAKCIQHELDHLNGTLFIDRLSSLKRRRVDARLAKWRREQERE